MVLEHCKIKYNKTVIYWKVLPLMMTSKSYYDGNRWNNLTVGKKAIIKTFIANSKYFNKLLFLWEMT